MPVRTPAILCSSRPHGEHGAVIRALSAQQGLIAAYVAGARGRQLRALLVPGNKLEIEFRAPGNNRLPSARIELLDSRGPWLTEPLAAAGIGWVTSLTAAALPEGHPYPALYDAIGATLDAICHAPSARGWAQAVTAYEALLLRELGYGLTETAPPQAGNWQELLAGLRRQGQAIESRLLADRRRDVMGARAILLDRLGRISGEGKA
jgi:DNA repair protein RecO (recombination protein O)